MTARCADLAYHFGLTPEQIGRLTDRQIGAIFDHPRDEHGAATVPAVQGSAEQRQAGPQTPTDPCSEDMAGLASLLGMGLIDRARHDELAAQLKAKYGRTE